MSKICSCVVVCAGWRHILEKGTNGRVDDMKVSNTCESSTQFIIVMARAIIGIGKILGRPFLKWFAICYQFVVLSCLSVTLVYCGQTVGWIEMPHLARR